ncbi:type VII secretion protein EssC [Intestinibacter bartlettii]|uniref:Type VII secretion protein EssC n=1 Tax=Intestinibacter bartlettii TaxID=261299 RepID=A0ABS6E0N4_9FIRM|nr:type VII secretion protein EssC [Intestinibacter bartlettii]MBU5337334.1 type VII secretion protein EssC [Intestinibacter bartlettii]
MHNYKLIIYGKKIYREETLDKELEIIKLGTTVESDIRFNENIFLKSFEIKFIKNNDSWTIVCDENTDIYYNKKILKSKELYHGDSISIKYRETDINLFNIDYLVDFDVLQNYDRVINIKNNQQITIGGTLNCDIYIEDKIANNEFITLINDRDRYVLIDNKTTYGVYLNGRKVNTKTIVKDYDFIMFVGYSFYLKEGNLYTTSENTINTLTLDSSYIQTSKSVLKYPKYNITTRKKYTVPEEEIEILPPTKKPRQPRKNMFLLLFPSIGMIVLIILLRGVMGGGGAFVIYSVCSMILTLIVSIISYYYSQRDYEKEIEEREKNYLTYIEEKKAEIIDIRKREQVVMRKMYKSMDSNLKAIDEFNNLFDRDIKDEDFLYVRVGTGQLPATCKINYKHPDFKDLDDPLLDIPESIEKGYKNLMNVPIVSRFSESNAVGILGKDEQLFDILINITVDLATRQYYKDVKFIYIFDKKDRRRMTWFRWFRHVENDDLGIRNMVYDEESTSIIFEYMYAILSKREQEKENQLFSPKFVVFVFDNKELKTHPVSKYIQKAKEYGFTFVFFEPYYELLPKGCTEIINLSPKKNEGYIFETNSSENKIRFEYQPISAIKAFEVAIKMAAIAVEEVSLDNDLTKNITLYELLHIMDAKDLDLQKRWQNSRIDKSIAVPLGVKMKNKEICLDLHEKYDGPHGLVAGTTGSGKSEVLQSYILSASTLYHPYELGFVIIDFKGGGMVNQFQRLPHLIGSITNIEGREIQRSLKSIKAELRKRQELFALQQVNHIDDYIKIYRQNNNITPLPHLVIIVDEFAELKMEYPEFMKELISAARIGRSLGVHLILATQKPSGVVDAQIWSNSKFKLCLKVQTKEDSNEVLKTPLAAEITEPGRAYLQVGNNEKFDLFQSAYSGAKTPNGDLNDKNLFELHQINLWGKKKVVYTNRQKDEEENRKNQLEAIVERIEDYCNLNNIKRLQGICLPPLNDVIYLKDLKTTSKNIEKGISVSIGVFDDPDQQMQEELIINLSQNNTYIIGSSLSGKTILLETILCDLIKTYTPQDVNIYAIDCGNMALRIFENSKIVGGVTINSEEDRINNLFRMLKNEIEKRKQVFLQRMVGTYSNYIESGFRDMSQIILIIDNVTAFREYYPSYDSEILMLSREGQSVGINLIVTGMQTNSLNNRMLSNYSTKISLHCNDKSEYSNLLGRSQIEPKDTAGRGLIVIDKKTLEFQTALPVEGNKEVDRNKNIQSLIESTNLAYGKSRAKKIPEVPQVIYFNKLFAEEPELFKYKYKIPIGIDYNTIEYTYFDLLENNLFAVVGRDKSGKTNFIMQILQTINKTILLNKTKAYIIDGSKRQLGDAKQFGFVDKYTLDLSDIEVIVDDIYDEFEERQDYYKYNIEDMTEEEILAKLPLYLIVVDNNEFISEISKNKDLNTKFINMLKNFKSYKMSIIFTNIENNNLSYNAPEILKKIKENKKAIIFEDLNNLKLFDVSMKQSREFAKPIVLGDGYIFENGEYRKIKTIKNN